MSKLGKKPIQIPKGSTVKIDGGKLSFNGPKGSKELKINDKIFSAEILKDNLLVIKPTDKKNQSKNIWGMTRSIVSNLIYGVSFGYEKTLEMTGVGYRASLKGNILNLQLQLLGFKKDWCKNNKDLNNRWRR